MENEKSIKSVPGTLERMKNIAKSTNALSKTSRTSQLIPRNSKSVTGLSNLGDLHISPISNGNLPNSISASEDSNEAGVLSNMTHLVTETKKDSSTANSTQLSDEVVQLPRNISKSVGSTVNLLDGDILSLHYVLVRSRETFSIPFSAFFTSEKSVSQGFPTLGETQLLDSEENMTNLSGDIGEKIIQSSFFSQEDLIIAEDGFLRDVQMKGFTGIWCHPATNLYFLMYLISKGMDNLYVLFI